MARPLKLDDPARRRPDGSVVTIGDAITTAISLGQDFAAAAKGAGISVATLHTWRVTGARARTQQLKGLNVTANDARLVTFLDALERAEADAELERLAIIHRATQPHQVVKVVEKVDPTRLDPKTGEPIVLERTTTTETRPGLWTPAAWWLERRMPAKYARRIELTGADGTDLLPADRARTLADSLVEFQQASLESGEAAEAAKAVRASRAKPNPRAKPKRP